MSAPAAKPNAAMVSALIDFELCRARLDGIRDRVRREGLTKGAAAAYLETNEQTINALHAIDRARYATQFPTQEHYDAIGGV